MLGGYVVSNVVGIGQHGVGMWWVFGQCGVGMWSVMWWVHGQCGVGMWLVT